MSFANEGKKHKGTTIKRFAKYENELEQKEAQQANHVNACP
jgi:hypothetical protein